LSTWSLSLRSKDVGLLYVNDVRADFGQTSKATMFCCVEGDHQFHVGKGSSPRKRTYTMYGDQATRCRKRLTRLQIPDREAVIVMRGRLRGRAY